MLVELYIKDIAIIHDLRVCFEPGFSVMTGETGAGKSIILGALNLVLGERVKADLLPDGVARGSVEALFDVHSFPSIVSYLEAQGIVIEPEELLVLRRDILRQGTHRNYINGHSVSLSVLKKLGDQFIDFHGQHDHQSLFHLDEQRDLLDQYAGSIPCREEVRNLYRELIGFRAEVEELKRVELEKKERMEFLEFQVREIEKAHLREGEEEELEEEQNRLAHAEKLRELFLESFNSLGDESGSATEKIGTTLRNMQEIARIDSSYEEKVERLQAVQIELKEMVSSLEEELNLFQADPGRLEEVENRLSLIWRLKQKYGNSLKEVLEFLKTQKEKLHELESTEEKLKQLEKRIQETQKELTGKTKELTLLREKAVPLIEKRVEKELTQLGMEVCQFKVSLISSREGAQGCEKVEFLIAPNVGQTPKPLRSIASGGEISRLMLALKVVFAKESSVPSLIFDEIDMNLSGGVTRQVGKKMIELGKSKQILCITHMPQVASQAEHHYWVEKKVEKGQTQTTITLLKENQKTREIARMLRGEEITSTVLEHARELIEEKVK